MRESLTDLKPAAVLAASRPHGVRIRYLGGCRCDECRRANTAYERERAKARKGGDWNGIVPADKARAHIEALAQAAVGRRQVSDASGVAQSIIFEIRSGNRKSIRARTERAILAVTVAAAADKALIDARPTWKLIDELLGWGYSKAAIARQLGYQTPALQIGRKQCTVRAAFNVERLHERLRCVPAKRTQKLLAELREEGYRPERIEAMVRDLAARKGIPPAELSERAHGFVLARAADLVEQLHAEIMQEVPA